MGGMLAPRIDLDANVKGIIIMAGSARTLHEIMLGQFDDIKRTSSRFTAWVLDLATKKMVDIFTKLDGMSDEEAKKVKMGGGTTAYYFKEMMKYPTDELLKKVEKPVFLLQGDADFQVSVEKDYKLYQEICKGKENVSFKLYEGLNHAFVQSISNDISKSKNEYNVERHIPKYVIQDIASWIQGHKK